jgi:hypothetical protein
MAPSFEWIDRGLQGGGAAASFNERRIMPNHDYKPAYEMLHLPESRVAEIKHDERTTGPVSVEALLAVIDRQGQVDGILECAEGLTYGEYKVVHEAWKRAEKPRAPKIRRQR